MRATLGFLILTAGCITVRTRAASGVDFASFHTFSFYQRPADQTAQIGFERSLAGQSMRAQIATDLRGKGLTEVAPGQPADLLVAYHARLQQQYQYTDWGYGAGWGYGWGGWGGGPMVTSYTEGTIIIDLLDQRSHTVVWRGTANAVVDHPDNPDPDKLTKAVNKVLDRLPSTMASAAPRTQM